jgi:hypothetical protein
VGKRETGRKVDEEQEGQKFLTSGPELMSVCRIPSIDYAETIRVFRPLEGVVGIGLGPREKFVDPDYSLGISRAINTSS